MSLPPFLHWIIRSPLFALVGLAVSTCSAVAQSPAETAPAAPLLQRGNARVVLVGDSITGQSRNHPAGYAHQIDWALRQVYPDCKPNVVALGGSGAGVQSWLNVEKRSRSETVFLDVKGIDVKAALDQPADVLIIMLGMNDVLAPYVTDEPASWEKWTAAYRELITGLRQRLNPAVTALATATLCTEEPASPKNRVMDELNAHAGRLASDMGLLLLPTNESMKEALRRGRRAQPDFHVTGDFVHPNAAGHIAIAMGMLLGLGETEAAQALETKRLAGILEKAGGESPKLSYAITALTAEPDSERQSFQVRCWATPPGAATPSQFSLSGEGWTARPAAPDQDDGEFIVTGIPDRRENPLKLTARIGDRVVTRDVPIPAPWLVTAGVIRKSWNDRQLLDPEALHGPMEDRIEQRRDFTVPLDIGHGARIEWRRYFPSVNFTGGNSPGSVDFAAVTHAQNFAAGYGARWIHSDRERPVAIDLSTQIFAGSMQMVVYLNGAKLYDGLLTGEPQKRRSIEGRLRPGWNALVFNLNHLAWQWQCTVDLKAVGDDSLEDLRYSILPHELAP